jgi:formate dehydrogenase
MAKVLCVLYPDPEAGYPPHYARDGIPTISGYANGQTAPAPKNLGFTPGELVGSVSGELGLRTYLEGLGHELIVTSDKDGPDSEFEKHLPDAEVVISQPFWPAYLTRERIAKAKKLRLALTAGIGSDHVDLDAAARAKVTVAEVTGSNSISVAEHVVMMVLSLVRNYLPSHEYAVKGGWNIADCVSRSYDVEGCISARWPQGVSASRCYVGCSLSACISTTPTRIGSAKRSRASLVLPTIRMPCPW